MNEDYLECQNCNTTFAYVKQTPTASTIKKKLGFGCCMCLCDEYYPEDEQFILECPLCGSTKNVVIKKK